MQVVQGRLVSNDEAAAIAYWQDKEHKKWAVDYAVGPAKRPTRKGTFYVGARTEARAIACCLDQAQPPLPKNARLRARLAGPAELGCVPTSVAVPQR